MTSSAPKLSGDTMKHTHEIKTYILCNPHGSIPHICMPHTASLSTHSHTYTVNHLAVHLTQSVICPILPVSQHTYTVNHLAVHPSQSVICPILPVSQHTYTVNHLAVHLTQSVICLILPICHTLSACFQRGSNKDDGRYQQASRKPKPNTNPNQT